MSTMSTTSPEQQATARRRMVDPAHSVVEFCVPSFWGLITVRGHFDRFAGSYTTDADGPEMELALDIGSLDTGNTLRDKHLRSADFFDIVVHPKARFTSTRIVEAGDGVLRVTGELEAAGNTVPLTFDATSRQDGDELEIEATTEVDHRRFGMTRSPLGMIRSPTTLHVKARLT